MGSRIDADLVGGLAVGGGEKQGCGKNAQTGRFDSVRHDMRMIDLLGAAKSYEPSRACPETSAGK
jgi:hypothetical protein